MASRKRTNSCLGELSEPGTAKKHKDVIKLSAITFRKQINHKESMDRFILISMKSHLFLTVLYFVGGKRTQDRRGSTHFTDFIETIKQTWCPDINF